MPRADLLSLTPDDLAALTNRGTVKRAQRELDSGETTFTIDESSDGEVRIDWSDEAHCVLPAGKTVSDARCDCVITTLCRHVVRSVLAYQQQAAGGATTEKPAVEPPKPWDPGAITDEALSAAFKPAVLTAARKRFKQGLLVDCVRSVKPTARFHELACTLRFVVPGDVRYTHCDCAEPAPCAHVPLAVWAFRKLPAEANAGFVVTQQVDLPVPAEVLDATEALLTELVEHGVSNLPPTWRDRVLRLEPLYAQHDLVWPWQVLTELVRTCEQYAAHDAMFSPDDVASLLGEWLVRADAIRSNTRAVPQALVRGSGGGRTVDIGSARYVGLGCGAELRRGGVTITAYLQDSDSGSLACVSREFADPPKESDMPPKPLYELAATNVVDRTSLASLGVGQLLLKGGKRSPDGRLTPGRARASCSPQAFAWESLRSPTRPEDYAELRARLGAMPPAALRARSVAEDLYVLPVATTVGYRFDEASQCVEALVQDAAGDTALVRHPYAGRAKAGTEATMAALADPSRRLLFVSGRVRLTNSGLDVRPVALVSEKNGIRDAVLPWVGRGGTTGRATDGFASPLPNEGVPHPDRDDVAAGLRQWLGELLLLGLRRADAGAVRACHVQARQGEAAGFDRLFGPVRRVADELTIKQSTPRWTAKVAVDAVLESCVLTTVTADVD